MGPKPPKQEKRLSAAQLVHPFSWERERKELPHGLHRLELSDILICDITIVQAGKCKNPTFFPNFSNFGLGRQRPRPSPLSHTKHAFNIPRSTSGCGRLGYSQRPRHHRSILAITDLDPKGLRKLSPKPPSERHRPLERSMRPQQKQEQSFPESPPSHGSFRKKVVTKKQRSRLRRKRGVSLRTSLPPCVLYQSLDNVSGYVWANVRLPVLFLDMCECPCLIHP